MIQKTPSPAISSRHSVFSIAWLASWVGLAGMLAQILLLRLLMSRSGGNELSLSIVSAVFLLAEGLGAWASDRVSGIFRAERLFALMSMLFALSMAVAPAGLAFGRDFFGLLPGEIIALPRLFLLALLLSFLPGFSHGASFTLICRMTETSPGRIFAWESAGTLAGGILFGFWMLRLSNDLSSLAILILATSIGLLPWLPPLGKLRKPGWIPTALFVTIILGFSLLYFRAPLLKVLLQHDFPGRIIDARQSPYSTMLLSRMGDEKTLYLDGAPYLVFPEAAVGETEASAHLPLLLHPEPRNILVIGGGPGQFISEVLRHPTVRRLSLIELDPVLCRMLKEEIHPTCFQDQRFELITTDARLFLSESSRKWDLIFLRLSEIDSFQVQRLFTVEAFEQMQGHLRPQALISLEFESSFPYIPSEERGRLAIVRSALARAFPFVREIPGERYRILGGYDSGELDPPLSLLLRRIHERDLRFQVFSESQLSYLLRPPISAPPLPQTEPNRDFQARALRAEISLYCARFSPRIGTLLNSTWKLPPAFLFGLTLLPLFPAFGGNRRMAIISLTAISGFLSMIFETTLALAFQIAAGALYGRLALLLALFMGGAALGAAWISRWETGLKQLRLISLLFSLLGLLTLFLLRPPVLPLIWFSILSGIAGGLSGMIYPIAVETAGRKLTGRLYGAEILGGFAGGILSVVLILGWGLRPSLALASLALLSAAASLTRFRE